MTERKAHSKIANDPNQTLADRVKHGCQMIMDGAKEIKEGTGREYKDHQVNKTGKKIESKEQEAEMLREASRYLAAEADAITDYLSAASKEAEHRSKEEEKMQSRKHHWDTVKDNNATLADRLMASCNAIRDGCIEMTEGVKRERAQSKVSHAKENLHADGEQVHSK